MQPVTIANAALEVRVATDSGPRITHLGRPTTEGSAAERNVLLVQDGVRLQPVEDGPAVTLRGGHRLWVAPETLELTYLPDDGPVDVTADDTTVVATATGGGIGKRLEVTLDGTVVRIRHQLTNATGRPQRIAAWGITQVPLGGTAVLPVGREPSDPHGMQAAGALVVWPYTDLTDPRLTFGPGWVAVEGVARREAPGPAPHPVKVGADGRAGWVAYARGDDVLVVRHAVDPTATYPDRGAAAQVYADDRGAEIETVGPLADVAPGGTVEHTATWELLPAPSDGGPAAIAALVTASAAS